MTGPGHEVTRRTARSGKTVMVVQHDGGDRLIGRLLKWTPDAVVIRPRDNRGKISVPVRQVATVYELID